MKKTRQPRRLFQIVQTVGVMTLMPTFSIMGADDTCFQTELNFSLDIGSASEISTLVLSGSPTFGGLDPGDIYTPLGLSCRLPEGHNGWINDKDMLNWSFDPSPAPDTGSGFRWAQIGSDQPTENYKEQFDIDGHDLIGVDLLILDGFDPGQTPVNPFRQSDILQIWNAEETGIYNMNYILISFDDDIAAGWLASGGSVPSDTASPTGETYGTRAKRDEVVQLDVFGGTPVWPIAVDALHSLASESRVHPFFLQNPSDAVDHERDDDVDSLDYGSVLAPLHFTVDHESIYGSAFIPGAIYRSGFVDGSGNHIPLIDSCINLGIPVCGDVDLDAFEFVWAMWENELALALLFSVDDDDPLTAADETGGLDAGAIYISFLTGWSEVFIESVEIGGDDVDAIATSPESNEIIQTRLLAIEFYGDLLEVNRSTGAVVTLGNIGSLANAMTSTPSGDVYAMGYSDELILVNVDDPELSTVVALSPPTGLSPRGIAAQNDNLIFLAMNHTGTSEDFLYSLDLTTLVYTEIGPLGHSGVQSLAFDHCGRLFGIDIFDGLLEINTSDASVIEYGGCGTDNQALVFVPNNTCFGGNYDLERIQPLKNCCNSNTSHTGIFSDVRGLAIIEGVPGVFCPGDVTGDGVVNIFDLLEVLSNWATDGSAGGDATGDGTVDVFDLLEVLNNWGISC